MAQETILLADNDIDFLKIRKVSLERAGYRVLTASDPIEARQLLSSTHIDLAILDIYLARIIHESQTRSWDSLRDVL